MASGHAYRAKGRTHGRSDQCCKVKILLANPEPSTHGPKRTLSRLQPTSAFDPLETSASMSCTYRMIV